MAFRRGHVPISGSLWSVNNWFFIQLSSCASYTIHTWEQEGDTRAVGAANSSKNRPWGLQHFFEYLFCYFISFFFHFFFRSIFGSYSHPSHFSRLLPIIHRESWRVAQTPHQPSNGVGVVTWTSSQRYKKREKDIAYRLMLFFHICGSKSRGSGSALKAVTCKCCEYSMTSFVAGGCICVIDSARNSTVV